MAPKKNPSAELHVRCCIAGGGPAGMMLGFLLARAGVEVVVRIDLIFHSFYRGWDFGVLKPSLKGCNVHQPKPDPIPIATQYSTASEATGCRHSIITRTLKTLVECRHPLASLAVLYRVATPTE